MANDQAGDVKESGRRPRDEERALLASPGRTAGLGLLLWALCVVAGGLAGGYVAGLNQEPGTVVIDPAGDTANVVQAGETTEQVMLAYLAYLPSVLLGLGGTTLLLIAAIGAAMDARGGSNTQLAEAVRLLEQANERLLLSDTAKRIAYRHEDLSVLRSRIREDIRQHHFDAALALIVELSQTYGYLEEAESFRDQIAAARAAEQEQKITAALTRVDDLIKRHDFEKAGAELNKSLRLYPDSERVKTAARRVSQSRELYKQQLVRDFVAAHERDAVEEASRLLKELDKYLTPEEAEPLKEIARGVIGKQRDNLGVQFKMAVHDKEWLRGVRIGEQIIREFPNTRMADEVRQVLDGLRERAAGQRAASAPA